MKDKGFKIIVSNQSGIGRGFYTKEDVDKLHNWINVQLKIITILVSMTFIMLVTSWHSQTLRRKPSPKMIEEALSGHNLDPERCLVGDKITDLQAAKKAKIKGFYLKEAIY